MLKNKEIKAGVGYTIGNILIKGITFLTLPIFSRLLSTSEYGFFNTYISYENIIAIIIGLGMYGTIKNAKYDYPEKLDVFISSILKISLYSLIIMFLITFIFKKQIFKYTSMDYFVVVLLLLQSFGTAMLNVSNARLSLDYDYKKYMKFAGFNTILNVILSLAFILTIFNDKRSYGRILGSALPLILIGGYIFYTEGKKSKFKLDKKMAKYALYIGLPLIWHYLSQIISSQFDRIMITSMVNSAATGIYSFVYTIASILTVIFYSIENVWTVWFYEQMDKRNYIDIRYVARKYMTLIAAITVLMMVGSKEVIIIMGDKEYWEGINLFIPIILGLYLLHLYTIPVGIEYYFKKTNYIAIVTAISAIANIILNYFCIKIWGYWAAAYTTMISYFLMFILHWYISQKLLKQNGIKEIFKLEEFSIFFFIISLLGISVALLNPYPIIKYILFLIVALLFMFKNRKDIQKLKSIIINKFK